MKILKNVSLALLALLLLPFQRLYGASEHHLDHPLKPTLLMDNLCATSGSSNPEGTLFDSGGQNLAYNDNENCSFLIDPGCALSLTLTFISFSTESCCDFIRIYDGTDESGTILLNHSGNFSPAPVVVPSGKAFIVFTSDGSVTGSGFELNWSSEVPTTPPVADFSVDNNPPLNTPVQFEDLSTNFANFWSWDFGDGNTSDLQNPFHSFSLPGTYNVRLIVDNCFATDTISKQITVQEAPDFGLNATGFDLSLGCGQDTSLAIPMQNQGAGDLLFQATQLGVPYSATSFINYETNGATTIHIFDGISPLIASLKLAISIKGDFDSSNEFATLYIDGDLIGEIEDGNVIAETEIIVNYQFDTETIAPWITDGSIMVTIENSPEVELTFGFNSDFHQTSLEALDYNWLNFSPSNEIIIPGGATELMLSISTENLNAGDYEEAILIQSNDPNQPLITIPINLQVVGEPEISLSSDCLNFPSTMQFRSTTLPLVISNSGCADLEITDVLTLENGFSWAPNPISIPPGGSDTLFVTYAPTIADNIVGELELINNAMPVTICLNASSFLAPSVISDSTSISVALFGCNDTLIVPLPIKNEGGSPLSYQFSGSSSWDNLALDSVRQRLNNGFEALTTLLPNVYLFSEGEIGHQIFDGGGDMYDGGNLLSVNNTFNYLPYANDEIVSNPELGNGGQYFTRKYPGLFVFAADINNINSFDISGDLGADGAGFVSATELTYSDGLNTYQGFVKKVHDAFDPSVHHLIIVKNTPEATHTYETQTFNDIHQVLGLNNASRIYYLLFAESAGAEYANDLIEEIMLKFIELVENPSFLELPEEVFSLDVNQSDTVNLIFTSSGRLDGVYQQNIIIAANDPLQPFLNIPTTMTIFGEPELALADSCLEFPSILQFTSITLPMVISNPGCTTLSITDMSVSEPAFSLSFTQATLAPGQSDTLMVSFSSQVADVYSGTVEIISNADTAQFCLSGTTLDAPLIQTDPETLSLDLFSCADTVYLPITVLNTGAGGLEYSFVGTNSGTGSIPLDTIRTRLNNSFNELTGLLPNIFLFDEGETGFGISDGGNDMYDGGNQLSVNNSFNFIPYSNDQIQGFADLGSNGQYFTRKYPGLFVFAADLNGVSSFNITGNLGADGNGQVNGAEIIQSFNGTNYHGFIKKVSGTFDPSVNHLIIVKNAPGANHTYDTTSEADDHQVNGLENMDRLYYLLFAGENGFLYNDIQIRELMIRFLELTEHYGFAELPEGNFLLEPGQSETFTIPFISSLAAGGTYDQNIVMQSNDPLQPNYELPVTVNISFDLCANFEFVQPIECGGQINFISTTINNPTSYFWDFGDGQTTTEANPSHYFASPGTYTVTLSVSNAQSSDNISRMVQIEEAIAPIEACDVMGSNNFPYAEITSFSLNSINNVSGSNNSNYTDFTCDFATTLVIGVPYDLSIITEFTSDLNTKLWVDLDNSGTFEADEQLFSAENSITPHLGSIFIPNASDNIFGIPLRCRVATDASFYFIDSCEPSIAGEFEDYTVILEPNMMVPSANYEFQIIDPCQGLVQFTDQSSNFPTSWYWDFGDGTISTAQDPTHVFSEAGVYTVNLSATNSLGVGAISFDITINTLNPSITLFNPPPVVNVPLNFMAQATGGISWQWDFGDGNTSTLINPIHTYEEEGEYIVSLTVFNGIGCQRTVSITIDVVLTDLDEVEKSFSIYPNPSAGDFWIDNQSSIPIKKVEIYNTMGQLLWLDNTKYTGFGRLSLTLPHFTDGVYFVHLHFEDNQRFVEKLVLQR